MPEREAILRSSQNLTSFRENACIIGHVTGNSTGMVKMKSRIDAQRIVDMLSGEQLPRNW